MHKGSENTSGFRKKGVLSFRFLIITDSGEPESESIPLKTTEGRREATENHREAAEKPQRSRRENNSVVLCVSSVVLCDCQGTLRRTGFATPSGNGGGDFHG